MSGNDKLEVVDPGKLFLLNNCVDFINDLIQILCRNRNLFPIKITLRKSASALIEQTPFQLLRTYLLHLPKIAGGGGPGEAFPVKQLC